MKNSKLNDKMKSLIKTSVPLKMFILSVTPILQTTFEMLQGKQQQHFTEVCYAYNLETAFDRTANEYKQKNMVVNIGVIVIVNVQDMLRNLEIVADTSNTAFPSQTSYRIDEKEIKAYNQKDFDDTVKVRGQNIDIFLCSLKYAADKFQQIFTEDEKRNLGAIVGKVETHIKESLKNSVNFGNIIIEEIKPKKQE